MLGSGLDVSYSDGIVRSFIYGIIKQKFYFTKIKIIHEVVVKPEPNILKTLPIIPSSTAQKITQCSYFILLFYFIPNVLILF